MLHQIWYFVKYESIFNSTPKIHIISKNVTRFTNLFEEEEEEEQEKKNSSNQDIYFLVYK